MPITAQVKPDCPYRHLLGETVPLASVVPIIPRDSGSPECYLIAVYALPSEQIDQLAQQIFAIWTPECQSVEQAREALTNPDGFPMRSDYFTGISITGKELALFQ